MKKLLGFVIVGCCKTPASLKNKINKIRNKLIILFNISRLKFFMRSKISVVNQIARPWIRQLGSYLLTTRRVFQ
jgi:hypothetical protein